MGAGEVATDGDDPCRRLDLLGCDVMRFELPNVESFALEIVGDRCRNGVVRVLRSGRGCDERQAPFGRQPVEARCRDNALGAAVFTENRISFIA